MDKLGYTFYPKDWWTSDTFFKLPPELRYLYLEIISMLYMNDGYWMPNRVELFKRFGIDPGEKGWEVLETLFVKDGDFWTHPAVNKRLRKTIANRENGKSGGRPKTQITQLENPKKPTLEREREREIKKEEERELNGNEIIEIGFGEKFFLIVPDTLHSMKYRIRGISGLKEYVEMNQSILPNPETHERFLTSIEGDHFKDFMHLKNKFNLFIKNQTSEKKKSFNLKDL